MLFIVYLNDKIQWFKMLIKFSQRYVKHVNFLHFIVHRKGLGTGNALDPNSGGFRFESFSL
jgi:hypothetical protein